MTAARSELAETWTRDLIAIIIRKRDLPCTIITSRNFSSITTIISGSAVSKMCTYICFMCTYMFYVFIYMFQDKNLNSDAGAYPSAGGRVGNKN